MSLSNEALEVLKETSRTFYIPISRLPSELLEAVASAYLCMRAIDEIEDHPSLDNSSKVKLLRMVGLKLQPLTEVNCNQPAGSVFPGYEDVLPEVTLRIFDWVGLAPETIAPRIMDSITAMAERMAYWAGNDWRISCMEDLDRYTFGVAGAVGLLLSDLWAWYDGTKSNRAYAIGFGRALQSVNILRNRVDDLSRGVDFFPDGWSDKEVDGYARSNLALAEAYIHELPPGPAQAFCKIPFDLANATLAVMAGGGQKLSRDEVIRLTAPGG